jgi:hypothetical protein
MRSCWARANCGEGVRKLPTGGASGLNANIVPVLPMDMFFDYLAIRIRGLDARGLSLRFDWITDGESWQLWLVNGVLDPSRRGRHAGPVDAILSMTREGLTKSLAAGGGMKGAIGGGAVQVEGDRAAVDRWIAVMDELRCELRRGRTLIGGGGRAGGRGAGRGAAAGRALRAGCRAGASLGAGLDGRHCRSPRGDRGERGENLPVEAVLRQLRTVRRFGPWPILSLSPCRAAAARWPGSEPSAPARPQRRAPHPVRRRSRDLSGPRSPCVSTRLALGAFECPAPRNAGGQ